MWLLCSSPGGFWGSKKGVIADDQRRVFIAEGKGSLGAVR